MKIISIDPGYKGALAVFEVNEKSNNFNLLRFYKMPIIKNTTKNKKVKTEVDIKKLYDILKQESPEIIALENVHAMPRMDVQSMFRFGEEIGIIKALAVTINAKIELVDIKTWKKYFNLSKDKKESIKKVKELITLDLKKTEDGIAESILIGIYYIEKGIINGYRNTKD